MTSDTDVATSWLRGLKARGVTASIRKTRLLLHPASAYRTLTDAERLTLSQHRDEIKALVKAGVSFDAATETTTTPPTVQPPPVCPSCYRAPCIGEAHPAFYTLHPVEAQKRSDDYRTHEMRVTLGRPQYLWDGWL